MPKYLFRINTKVSVHTGNILSYHLLLLFYLFIYSLWHIITINNFRDPTSVSWFINLWLSQYQFLRLGLPIFMDHCAFSSVSKWLLREQGFESNDWECLFSNILELNLQMAWCQIQKLTGRVNNSSFFMNTHRSLTMFLRD